MGYFVFWSNSDFLFLQAWKKFAGSVEGVAKALKKKDIKGANAAYNDSMVLLDEYLKQVELPDAKEISA